ncbi:PREDICTED: putative RING-H2 finger protein ATL21A [Erythranthe guttata]|uniref:putative RING-H2 finger protein ATL21A n=1 Tax=Erythranthe guttata TaxID=4155 RepID=UPI00064DE230|nr:PREDICTED: putative RING-H2 finger protein ATL21A [Erythranthe guttata]|eukprot:XP_012843842.1 PREDICTED: putative RING-H2 finger protein ATL21A [Erythranthe guttata]
MAIRNFFVFVFLFLSIVHAQNNCPPSYCNNNSQAIRFPFWLQGRQLPSNCQPIGFNLSCNDQSKAILNIPRAGDFYVSYINYNLNRITLSDPDNCLPRKFLSSNLSYSPFMAVSYQNYTYHSCPKGLGINDIYIVHCLSNATTDISVIKNEVAAVILPNCKKMVTVPIPVSYLYGYTFPVNLVLRWDDVPATPTGKDLLLICISHTIYRDHYS